MIYQHLQKTALAKATLTGVMEELWFKFAGKERWRIKSLQMGNNFLDKYFY